VVTSFFFLVSETFFLSPFFSPRRQRNSRPLQSSCRILAQRRARPFTPSVTPLFSHLRPSVLRARVDAPSAIFDFSRLGYRPCAHLEKRNCTLDRIFNRDEKISHALLTFPPPVFPFIPFLTVAIRPCLFLNASSLCAGGEPNRPRWFCFVK